MKHLFTLKTIMLACLLFVGMGAWGAEVVSYTFQTAQSGGNTAYATNYNITVDNKSWSCPGNQNFSGYVRIGGKSLTNTAREIYSKETLSDDITKVVLNHNGVSNAALVVNSITLTVASDDSFTSDVQTKVLTSPSVSSSGSLTFTPTSGTWGANKYYKITFNLTNSTTSNYGIDVTSIVFYKNNGGDPILYTVTLGDNSEELTQATEGANVTLPTRVGNSAYSFAGWSTTNNAVETTTKPVIIAAGNYQPTANVTLYPVYKRLEGEEGYILSETVSGTTYYMKHDCSATTTKSQAEAFEWNTSTGLLTYTSGSSTYYITHQTSGSTSLVNNTTVPASGKEWTITDNTTNKTVKFNSKAQTTRYLGYSSGFKAYAASHTLNYELAGTVYYISSLPAEKTTPTLSFANPTYNATIGDAFVAPTLTNPQGVTVSYSSSSEGVATVNATTGAISLVAPGTTTITASYDGSESDTYNSNSASYELVVSPAPFASLEELVAADLTLGTLVTVSFENVPIKAFQTVSSTRKGVYFDIQKGGNDIEIYFNSAVPATWVEGGTLSGTMTCPWTLYNGTWELAPASGWTWTSLTYNAPAATYEVNLEDVTNGTISANVSEAAEGVAVTLTATPDDGYEFDSWYVLDDEANEVTVTNNQFIMPASDVYVSATFVPEPANVIFDLTKDETIEATEELLAWNSACVSMRAEKAESSTAANNYYPGTVDKNYTSTRFYKNSTLTLSPAQGVTIIKVVYNATTTNYANELQSSAWTNATAAVSATTVTITPTDGTQPIVVTMGNTTGASSIKVFYSGTPTATITLNSACTDGEKVYGTYSNAFAWVVPSNLTVSEVSVVDGVLITQSYQTSDIVPANTGVMVSAAAGGNYNVEIETDPELIELAESVLDEDNCLRPTGNGITAAEMAQADTEFFRLTMHNGNTIGFFWGAEDGAAFALGANKAYLAVATENLGLGGDAKGGRLWINNSTTGIKTVNTEATANKAVKRIMNGQLVIEKAGKMYNAAGAEMK